MLLQKSWMFLDNECSSDLCLANIFKSVPLYYNCKWGRSLAPALVWLHSNNLCHTTYLSRGGETSSIRRCLRCDDWQLGRKAEQSCRNFRSTLKKDSGLDQHLVSFKRARADLGEGGGNKQ